MCLLVNVLVGDDVMTLGGDAWCDDVYGDAWLTCLGDDVYGDAW